MVMPSPIPASDDIILSLPVPVIDLSWRREIASERIVRACQEFGFFKLINHGVSKQVIKEMEARGKEFFSLPAQEKRRAGPPNPLGYGRRNIGFNGDTGELEYLLLHTNPNSISMTISKEYPSKFSDVVNEYVVAVRKLACDILDMVGEDLGIWDKRALSSLLRDSESDSLVRLNHYPPCCNKGGAEERKICNKDGKGKGKIGFGEHTDPQIISILRSNDVDGLQVLSSSTTSDVWVPVPSDPSAFYVQVGDTLEVAILTVQKNLSQTYPSHALTNGRLVSVRHRAMTNSYSARLSMIYFGAPPLDTWISPLPEMVTPEMPRRFRSFTWAEYKKTMYSLRLSHNRLDLFRIQDDEASKDTIN